MHCAKLSFFFFHISCVHCNVNLKAMCIIDYINNAQFIFKCKAIQEGALLFKLPYNAIGKVKPSVSKSADLKAFLYTLHGAK